MTAAPAFASYSFNGYDELCLKAVGAFNRQILLIPPLFDEMNRMRRILVDVMRLLEEREVGSVLLDLPGTNESPVALENVDLPAWRDAVSLCADQHESSHIASFRGGCLSDSANNKRPIWRLASVNGSNLLRTMMRTRIASDKESGHSTTIAELSELAGKESINLAGNVISPALFAQLGEAVPGEGAHIRTVRLESDGKPADIRIAGGAAWLRAEPDEDIALSTAIAGELAAWVRQ